MATHGVVIDTTLRGPNDMLRLVTDDNEDDISYGACETCHSVYRCNADIHNTTLCRNCLNDLLDEILD